MQKGTVVRMEEGPGSSWGMDTDLWYISLDSFAGTKAPTLLDNGNFRLSAKSWSTALWSHYQTIRGGLHPQQPASQILSIKSCLKPLSLPVLLALLFSHSVDSDSLRPHGLQHAGRPCPSPTLSACSNSCPSSWWCHPAISSSVAPFSSCLQPFPASGSFLMS